MNHVKVWIWTVASSLVLWLIFLILGMSLDWFIVPCGSSCPGTWTVFFAYSFVVFPFILLVSVGVNYLLEIFRTPR